MNPLCGRGSRELGRSQADEHPHLCQLTRIAWLTFT
jgi:hypothetical protein